MAEPRTDTGRRSPSGKKSSGQSRRWAICASVTDELLNDLALMGVGDGVAMEAVEQEINMPAMGEVRLRLALTVTVAARPHGNRPLRRSACDRSAGSEVLGQLTDRRAT